MHEAHQPEILSRDWALISSLAEFGLLLRDSQFKGQASFSNALKLAQAAFGSSDPARQEYVSLVARAAAKPASEDRLVNRVKKE